MTRTHLISTVPLVPNHESAACRCTTSSMTALGTPSRLSTSATRRRRCCAPAGLPLLGAQRDELQFGRRRECCCWCKGFCFCFFAPDCNSDYMAWILSRWRFLAFAAVKCVPCTGFPSLHMHLMAKH